MKKLRLIFGVIFFTLLLPTYAFKYSEIEGLSDHAKEGARIIYSKNNLTIKEQEQVITLIQMESDFEFTKKPADLFLLGLIYSDNSKKFDDYTRQRYENTWPDPYTLLDPYDFDLYPFVEDHFHEFFEEDIPNIYGMSRETPIGNFSDPFEYKVAYEDYKKTRPNYSMFKRDRAISYFQSSSDKGYKPAYVKLATLYATDIKRNESYKDLALNYYNKAMEAGYKEAFAQMGYEYVLGTNIVNCDYKKAVEFLNKAVQAGDNSHPTLFCLGYCYEKGGYGIKKDLNKAVEYYSKVSINHQQPDYFSDLIGEGNNYSAPWRLALLYYLEPEIRNYDKAFNLFKALSDKNLTLENRYQISFNKIIYRLLSACYRFGRGTPVNEEMADFYLEKAGDMPDLETERLLENISFGSSDYYIKKDPSNSEEEFYYEYY